MIVKEADFDRKIEALQQYLEALKQRATGSPEWITTMLPDACEELQTALEELQVAEEELRQQNEELAASRQAAEVERQRYQELFDFAPDGYLVTDTAGIIREANRAATALLNIPHHLVVGKPLAVFVDPEDLKTFRARLAQLPQRQRLQDWEVRLRPRRNASLYAVMTVTAVHDAQSRLVGLRWLLRDVSAHKALSESVRQLRLLLAAEQQQQQSLVQYLPEGVALLDAERRLVLANPGARRYLAVLCTTTVGEELTVLGGQPVELFFTPCDHGLTHEVVLAGPPYRVFEIQTTPITAGPEGGGWVLLIQDVTAERITQQQTEQQQRLAAVGQLAAGVAHEFNNLLFVMIGYADLLKGRTDLPEPVQDHLTVIAEQGRRGARFVRQILDFSRQPLAEPRQLDLLPVLKETGRMLERALPESVRVVLDGVPGEYLVNADLGQLQQLLTNLAVNARDAMPDGGELCFCLSHFTLSPGQQKPCSGMPLGEWVLLTISDTGTGISPDKLAHIFEPFYTTKAVGQGTGLGLAQVYGIVKQHNGYITVHSQPGRGTTFTLYLPASEVPADTAGEAVPEEIPRGQGETVLVVEDDPQVLELLRIMLDSLHYRVLTATNGREALILCERYGNTIALVLTDLVMPEVGGEALFWTLRQRDLGAKVIVLTGYPLQEQAPDLLTQGITAWLQKPPALPALAQAVRQALTGES